MTVFEQVVYFKREENWGDPDKVNPFLIRVMDHVRAKLGAPVHINNAFELTGHSPGSEHYKGNAVDFTVSMDFLEAYRRILDILDNTFILSMPLRSFCGFGAYLDWNTPGFHLDVRGYPASWGRSHGVYISLENFEKELFGCSDS